MNHIKVVIGANFGDEGKGMLADYFTQHTNGSVLNVLYNGGMQRGHTVGDTVYHCFGAGSGSGADTYYREHFIINPIAWAIEQITLKNVGTCYLNENCRVSIPYDELINQAIENERGNKRHGSCGMGIYETRIRNEKYPLTIKDAYNPYYLYSYLKDISKEYVPYRCKELGIDINFNIDIDLYLMAVNKMFEYCKIVNDENQTYDNYDTVIFEAGQGLLLSEDNTSYSPNLTPSYTGSKYIANFINSCMVDTEVCYVTRSYLTRHGAGRFDTECLKEDINPNIIDKTNQPNQYQQSLRFGWFDKDNSLIRVFNDLNYYKRPIKSAIAITHLNYTNGKLACGVNNYQNLDIIKQFSKGYVSYCKDEVQPYTIVK